MYGSTSGGEGSLINQGGSYSHKKVLFKQGGWKRNF
jgi:hypothetical protein